jgi:hypothetical protein
LQAQGYDPFPVPSQAEILNANASSGVFDFSQFNPYGVGSLSDAWFGQHLVNLEGMDFNFANAY